MERLVRRRVGEFDISDAVTLAAVQEYADAGKLDDILIPVDEVFARYGSIRLGEAADRLLYNGNPFRRRDILEKTEGTDGERYRVYDSAGIFYGVFFFDNERGIYRPYKMFIPDRT